MVRRSRLQAEAGVDAARPKYESIPGHYDEMLANPGVPRRHWRRVVAALSRIGDQQLGRRWQQSLQLIQTNGISYSMFQRGSIGGHISTWLCRMLCSDALDDLQVARLLASSPRRERTEA